MATATGTAATHRLHALHDDFIRVRRFSTEFCQPLAVEDMVIQTMTDASPTKWHLAHETWFFETFVLKPFLPEYKPFHVDFEYLFNSYYNAVGEQFPRPLRGLVSRPTVAEVLDYRAHVDAAMETFFQQDEVADSQVLDVIEIGLNHEQQHQELMITDLKTVFGANPLFPAYDILPEPPSAPAPDLNWIPFPENLYEIGHDGEGFAYDNESPRHRCFLEPFELANRLVTNGEYIEFIRDGGYDYPDHWLSEGWAAINENGWRHPMYWVRQEGQWHIHTLGGLRPIDPNEPVCHISLYEADAYARWAGARLPREEEWEVAAAPQSIDGNFVETRYFHPVTYTGDSEGLVQLFGDVWEWMQSQYTPYPGYSAPPGALGEYNGKFMCNQHVLRGGSCATSREHIRSTYRNFFPAHARWQFSGVRLARDLRG